MNVRCRGMYIFLAKMLKYSVHTIKYRRESNEEQHIPC